ncbi:MAG: hypothetical protein JOZ20_04725 [Sphingomonas sp.]|nr:hypothetical protein [Sphingomonas sp.]MBW0008405.1 hypothetical protein [Sphingomonas sp.]
MATAAVAAAVARARREIQHHFFSHDAVRPERAVAFEPSKHIEQRQFERMRSRGIIREAKPGLFWLDVVAYDIDLRQRHERIRWVLLVLVIALAIGLGVSVASH